MWNGFGRSVNTYFVWLEQQVGAGEGGRDGAAAGHHVPRHGRRRRSPPTRRPTGVRSPSAWPPPPRSTWPTRTRRWRRRGRTARRCRSVSVTDPDGQRAGRRRPVVPSGCSTPTWRARRPTRPAARSASSRPSAQCNGGTARRYRHPRRPPGRPARPAARTDNATETFVGVHPADGGRRHRGQPGRPHRRGRRGRAGPGDRRGRPDHRHGGRRSAGSRRSPRPAGRWSAPRAAPSNPTLAPRPAGPPTTPSPTSSPAPKPPLYPQPPPHHPAHR